MPVTWSSQRQKLVTLSTIEAEYVAAATAVKEIVWLRQLLSDLDCKLSSLTKLYIDNTGLQKNFLRATESAVDDSYRFLVIKI